MAYARYVPAARTWVVSEARVVPETAYEQRTRVAAVLSAAFLVEVANKARLEKLSVVLIHTHPDAAGRPRFSGVDDAGEVDLAEYFNRRVPAGDHLALVIGPDGCACRRLGTQDSVQVWAIGRNVRHLSMVTGADPAHEIHDRQIRAFGKSGQQAIRSTRLGIVGAGGTGSVTGQQLAYLGVPDMTVVDPDTVDETNLNRLVGGRPTDIGVAKVAVAHRTISDINPDAIVRPVKDDVVNSDVLHSLIGLDFIFLCTDSHASRAAVCQLAYQYLIPVIDMGVSISVGPEGVTHITGRVQMLAPGLPCLTCSRALNAEQIRRELLTPEARAADPYVQGVHEPQPAVVSINSTIASLAVTMFLGAMTPINATARFQRYDGVAGAVRLMAVSPAETCIICTSEGVLAAGSSEKLLCRAAPLDTKSGRPLMNERPCPR